MTIRHFGQEFGKIAQNAFFTWAYDCRMNTIYSDFVQKHNLYIVEYALDGVWKLC